MTPRKRIEHITRWIKSYASSNKVKTLVVGISGGIDSSVVSTLCARTSLDTIVVQMPIRQNRVLDQRSSKHAGWLIDNFPHNVRHMSMDLTPVFNSFEKRLLPFCGDSDSQELAFANSRSRLRMMTLYQIAQSHHGIVVGTGNRVEDFGVGFFTKYGDGGVDISPIGDCLKTEVWDMGRDLGILEEIINAEPTDGLWNDGRTDEQQLTMTYPELEQAMHFDTLMPDDLEVYTMDAKQKRNLRKYQQIRQKNLHKMLPIPVCTFPGE